MKTLTIKHDTYEYVVDLNKVECTYCGELESQDEIHCYGDTDMCEACYQNMVE